MIDFGKCVKEGEVAISFNLRSDVSDEELMHRLAMGELVVLFSDNDYWEFGFSGFYNESGEIGNDERFALVCNIDVKNVTVNSDGTHSLNLPFYVWENKRLFKARKVENAICVPLEIRFIPGEDKSWDVTHSLLLALKRAEEIRANREKVLTLKPQNNGNTLVMACDNTMAEVNTMVMGKAQELIREFGIKVVSLDVDRIICEHGEIRDLNLHIDNPEALKCKTFEEKRYKLTEFADKYDWDIWFVSPGHERNEFIESIMCQ